MKTLLYRVKFNCLNCSVILFYVKVKWSGSKIT
nr:MAG TPA: hypothetical protein [Caudoviricetes sp.]